MGYTSYEDINSLDEVNFIAGTKFTFYYAFYLDDGVSELTLTGGSVDWVLCPYGNFGYTALQKTGTITGTNTCKVELTEADTLALSGKFIQQPVLTNNAAEVFRPAQGVVLITAAIPVA